MRPIAYLVGLFLISVAFSQNAIGQSCCSGGVPISSSIGFNSVESNTLQMSLSADFNVLTDLYAGSDRLEDNLRKRTTQSYLLRLAYTFKSRYTVEAFFSTIRQTRKIYTINDNVDFESSFGVGDPAVLFIYDVIQSPLTWRIGAGPQIPLGSTTKTNSRGLFLVEDLQPGSGAWDLVLFNSLEYRPASRPSLLVYLNGLYSLTGKNNESRNENQTYEFGNDLLMIGGLSDQIFLFGQVLNPGIGLKYRFAERDQVDGFPNNGTGGKFLFLRLSNGIPFKNGFSINLSAELPLYTFVNDTQLVTNYIINIGLYKKLNLGSKKEKGPRIFIN